MHVWKLPHVRLWKSFHQPLRLNTKLAWQDKCLWGDCTFRRGEFVFHRHDFGLLAAVFFQAELAFRTVIGTISVAHEFCADESEVPTHLTQSKPK